MILLESWNYNFYVLIDGKIEIDLLCIKVTDIHLYFLAFSWYLMKQEHVAQ